MSEDKRKSAWPQWCPWEGAFGEKQSLRWMGNEMTLSVHFTQCMLVLSFTSSNIALPKQSQVCLLPFKYVKASGRAFLNILCSMFALKLDLSKIDVRRRKMIFPDHVQVIRSFVWWRVFCQDPLLIHSWSKFRESASRWKTVSGMKAQIQRSENPVSLLKTQFHFFKPSFFIENPNFFIEKNRFAKSVLYREIYAVK